MPIKLVTVVGARPQFVKAATLSREILARDNIDEVIIHTGQHFDENMSDVFFQELQIPAPKYNLAISNTTHGDMTGKMLSKIESILLDETPDAILVYGDTNSTLAGALAGAKLSLPIIHAEAGLRSYNRQMPEEINRVLTDHMSTILLCPTQTSVSNLKKEGITKGVYMVGDVMYDATLFAKNNLAQAPQEIEELLSSGDFGVLTIHRAESTKDPGLLRQLLEYTESYAQNNNIQLVFPVHPRTKNLLETLQIETKNIIKIDPVSYFGMQSLLSKSKVVLTDSGGLQKEAYFHRVPCITLRTETEWVETIEKGWNRLWTDADYSAPRTEISDYGTGNSAIKMIDAIQNEVRS